MKGSGRVLQAGLASRPNDGVELLKVATDAPGSDNAFWLDHDAEAPPGGVLVSWDGGHAWWLRDDGSTCRQRRRGYLFDDRRRELG